MEPTPALTGATSPKTLSRRLRTSRTTKLLPLLLLLMLPAIVVHGYHQDPYSFNIRNGTITITRYSGAGGAVTIPNTITNLPVTSIGGGAFDGCSSLTSVTIPSSVTSIGDLAFRFCTSLTGVTIPDSVTSIGNDAFMFCTSLTGVTIPDSVTSIGNGAFSGCSSLTGVTIPDSVTSIEREAFSGCYRLTSVTIPNSVTSIGGGAFDGCCSLTSVTIPSSVTSIGDLAFRYCTNLTSVTIPNSVTSIGDSAFYGCASLTGVTIPNSVTSIGDSAFSWCYRLTSVTIPNSVTSIGGSAFSSCYRLTSVTMGDGVASIGLAAFSGTGLINIIIPNSVTNIGEGAFGGCTSLVAITVNTNNSAYSSVDGVLLNKNQTTLIQYPGGKGGNYTVPDSVTNIGLWAFSLVASLTNVTISSGVATIEDNAFFWCDNLKGVYFKGNAPSVGYEVFSGDTNTVYHLRSTMGWPPVPDEWAGRPTALWDVSIKFLRASHEVISNPMPTQTHFDEPLLLFGDHNLLDAETNQVLGLVADGVTPLLIRIGTTNVLSSITDTIEATVTGGAVVIGGVLTTNLSEKVRVWEHHALYGDQFVLPGDSDRLSSEDGQSNTYAYIMPIASEDLIVTNSENELVLIIKIKDGTNDVASATAKIRRPPIVLVHGYFSDGATWFDDGTGMTHSVFIDTLATHRPRDFITNVSYGVISAVDEKDRTLVNTVGPLTQLAALLHEELKHVEADLHRNWAFTRYDAVGHSQGGVLLRLLSSNNSNPRRQWAHYRQPDNCSRGRFHRVITIGSPHNGSRVLTYMREYERRGFTIPKYFFLLGPIVQEKFDSFGPQIEDLNIHWIPDTETKAHLISTLVSKGQPPTFLSNPVLYWIYRLLGLADPAKLLAVLPEGSDTITDSASARSASAQPDVACSVVPPGGTTEIAHAMSKYFGIARAQATSPLVASRVIELLEGSPGAFAAFRSPTSLPPAVLAGIYGAVPVIDPWLSLGTAITIDQYLPKPMQALSAASGGVEYVASGGVEYVCNIVPAEGQTVPSNSLWWVEVWGIGGATTNGVTVTPDPVVPGKALVWVDDTVTGDVVVFASYLTASNTVVQTRRMLVVSHPLNVPLTGISIVPRELYLSVGSSASIDVWGTYSNGLTGLLFVPDGDAQYQSADPSVAIVNSNGLITCMADGSSQIQVVYKGWVATAKVFVGSNYDSDGDGLPDNWELEYASSLPELNTDQDADNDGMNNLAEYIAGTDPTDASSRLEITGVHTTPGGLQVDWMGGTDVWQYLESRQDLLSTAEQWTAIFSNSPPTAISTNILSGNVTNRLLYYRIRAVR